MNQELWMACHATHFPAWCEDLYELGPFMGTDPILYFNTQLRSDGEWPR